MKDELNPFPKEEGASQVNRHATVVAYLFTEKNTRKAKPLGLFQFPEGETPTYPRVGELTLYPPPYDMMVVDDVIHAQKFHNGTYTHFVTVLLRKSDKNMTGIYSN